jgi:hypothetical protein
MLLKRCGFALVLLCILLSACSPNPAKAAGDSSAVDQAVKTQLAGQINPTQIQPETLSTQTLQPNLNITNNPISTGSASDLAGLIFSGGELQHIQLDGSIKTLYPKQIEALSPDSKLGLTNSNGDFWLAHLDTQSITRLTMTENRVECCATWWNNHPEKILFLSNTLRGNTGVATSGYITVIKQDGSGYLVLDPDHPSTGVPAVSPDGVWIAYGYGETAWLFGGELGPQKIDPVEYGLVSLKGQSISMPAWSPDGRYLAWRWQSDLNSGSKVGVLILDLVEKSYRLGTLFSVDAGIPELSLTWSPDGKWLAYTKTSSNPDESGTYLIQADTANLDEIKITYSGILPQLWSPDGAELVLLANQAPELGTFYLFDLANRQVRRIGLEQYLAGSTLAWFK